MDRSVRFVVEGQPVPKQRPRVVYEGARAHAYTPAKTKNWETTIAWMGRAAMGARTPLEVDLRACLFFYRKGKRRADLDNLVKAVKDALNGIIYIDDQQIVAMNCEVRYNQESPRIEIEITPYEEHER